MTTITFFLSLTLAIILYVNPKFRSVVRQNKYAYYTAGGAALSMVIEYLLKKFGVQNEGWQIFRREWMLSIVCMFGLFQILWNFYAQNTAPEQKESVPAK